MNKALIIVDVWDNHWDYDTFKNTDKLAKEINSFASVFRENGDCVIHAPSMVRRQYKSCDIPIKVDFDMIEPYKLESKLKDLSFPLITDGDGKPNWTKQHEDIEILDEDYVSTSGLEIFNILKQNEIEKLYYSGMHANICMLWTRPFSIMQMLNNNISTCLVSDLSFSLPLSKHEELLSFYEKYICKTITKKEIYKEKNEITK